MTTPFSHFSHYIHSRPISTFSHCIRGISCLCYHEWSSFSPVGTNINSFKFISMSKCDWMLTKSKCHNWLPREEWHLYRFTGAFALVSETSQHIELLCRRISLRQVKMKNWFESLGCVKFWPHWTNSSCSFSWRFRLLTHSMRSLWLCTAPQAYSNVSRGG